MHCGKWPSLSGGRVDYNFLFNEFINNIPRDVRINSK